MNVKTHKALSVLLISGACFLAAGNPALAGAGDSVSGGGQLLDSTPTGTDYKISFGIWANEITAGVYEGEVQINFHSVSDPGLSKAKFSGARVTALNFFAPTSTTCNSAMNMTVEGTLNGVPGYYVILRAGDAGSPGNTNAAEPFDTARIELYYGSKIYDTDWDYQRQSSCVGTARTGLDRGNITIEWP